MDNGENLNNNVQPEMPVGQPMPEVNVTPEVAPVTPEVAPVAPAVPEVAPEVSATPEVAPVTPEVMPETPTVPETAPEVSAAPEAAAPTGTAPAPAAEEDKGSFGWAVLGFFIPLVGLILFLAWKNTKPKSAKKAGIGALVSTILSVISMILMATVFSALISGLAGAVENGDIEFTYDDNTVVDDQGTSDSDDTDYNVSYDEDYVSLDDMQVENID